MKSNASSFPKIFFVNDYSPDAQVLADLIRQLLVGYPVEKIAWWHCRRMPVYAKPDLQAGSRYCFPQPNRLVPSKRLPLTKSWILENLWVPLAARHLRRSIAAAQPDLVWIWLQHWSGMVVTAADLRNVRLHASLWDYPDTNSFVKTMGAARVARYKTKIFEQIKRADTYDTLCPGSLEEIFRQTGRKDGLIVHSGFEPSHLQALESNSAGQMEDAGVLRLAYVGTIISEKGFMEMLAALEKARASQPRKVVLEFFGNRNYRHRPWFKADWMVEHGLFTDQGLIEALRRCSWGIVVTDPEGEDLPYCRFSFPNKVGSYLSSGVPVLGFGHAQSCLGRMMREQNCGRFTSAATAAEMAKFFLDAFQVPTPRQSFRDGILRCAQTEFDAAGMRSRLWQAWGVH